MDEPGGVLEVLTGLQKRLDQIQAGVGVSPTEFALANAMAVLVSVMLHERKDEREYEPGMNPCDDAEFGMKP